MRRTYVNISIATLAILALLSIESESALINPKASVIQTLSNLGLTGHWAGQCIQFGATNQATNAPTCIPYKSKSGPISYFYSVDYFVNGTAALVNAPGGPLLVPATQGKPSFYATYVPSNTYGTISSLTLIPSVPNQQVACVKLIQDDGASVSYVANITKSTDPKTGLVTFTYIENGIVNQANNNYVDSCNGYKPTLFCNSKTYNYQCQMVFAVGTTGR